MTIGGTEVDPGLPSEPIRFGDLVIDRGARKVSVAGDRLDLPRLEYDLLVHLAENVDRVFTREELLRDVWRSRPEWQSSATVTEHVRRLRSRLLRTSPLPVRISAIRGVGYLLETVDLGPTADPLLTQGLTHSSVVVDGDVVVDISVAAVDLLGADTADEIVGRGLLELFAHRSLAAARSRIERRAADELLPPERLWLRRFDGRDVLVEVSTGAIVRDGRLHHRIDLWPVADADPANRAKVLLGITSELADAVIVLDAGWRFQTVNAAAETMYGWREHEVVGKSIVDVLPTATADDLAAIERRLSLDGHWHGDVEQSRRDGTSVLVRLSATLMGEEVGNDGGVVLVCRSVGTTAPDPDVGADVVGDIPGAFERNEFFPHFQPILNLETRRVIGVEALARWDHPSLGVLPPRDFLDALARSGDIVRLGSQMLARAAAQVSTWRARGISVDLAVNISVQQLLGGTLADDIGDALEHAGLSSDHLLIELTETDLIIDVTAAAQMLDQITATGVRVAIDDFGTGWASLTYLKRLPVHVLKIDRAFTSGLPRKPRDLAIVRSIISLGKELDLIVVAEGVETADQEACLLELGCSIGQGHLYGRAEPAESVVLTAPRS